MIVSLDKAFKTKVHEYKNLIIKSEGLFEAAQKLISEYHLVEGFLENTLNRFQKNTDEVFANLAQFLENTKMDLMKRLSKDVSVQKNWHHKTAEELKFHLSNACLQIDYQGISLEQFAKDVNARKESLAKIEELVNKSSSRKVEAEISIGDAELDTIVKRVKLEISKLSEKTSLQSSVKNAERLQTPSRNHTQTSKANIKPHVDGKPITSTNIKDTPLTPRLTKDPSKKSLTRSKSPIFKTDIRIFSLHSG